jgi:catechol 2,3-dioxygenase-like lactoylglutathione lyase family enzyme
MKLGNYAHVSIAVQRLKDSVPFYTRLGFRKLWESDEPAPWMLMTDGKLNVHLFESLFPSPSLHYFSDHMGDRVLELMRLGIRPEPQRSKDGKRMQHNFLDPNELTIMLMHFDDAAMPKPNGFSESKLGVFGELSVDTENLEESIAFWQKLDYSVALRGTRPYPWATMTDGVMTVSFHQTQAFRTPALTYFTSDVVARLRALRADGIEAIGELHDEHNTTAGAVITAPDGQVFFLLEGE